MRRPVCLLVATGLAAAVGAVGACSSGSTPLAQLSPTATSSATVSPTGSATPSTTGGSTTTGATTPVTGVATSSGSLGPARTNAEPLPSSVTGDATAAADAYVAYWTFVTTAGSDPQGVDAAAAVGKIATGQAAGTVIALIGDWKTKGVHLVGTLSLRVTKATVEGSTGTVCGLLQDLTVTADPSGAPTQPLLSRESSQSAALRKDGPSWRVSEMTEVPSC